MTIYILAIHGFVSTFVGLHHGAVQAHPSENAFGTRIRQISAFSLRSVPAPRRNLEDRSTSRLVALSGGRRRR